MDLKQKNIEMINIKSLYHAKNCNFITKNINVILQNEHECKQMYVSSTNSFPYFK